MSGNSKTIKVSPEDEIEVTLSFESSHKHHILGQFKLKAGSGQLAKGDLLAAELKQKAAEDHDRATRLAKQQILAKKRR